MTHLRPFVIVAFVLLCGAPLLAQAPPAPPAVLALPPMPALPAVPPLPPVPPDALFDVDVERFKADFDTLDFDAFKLDMDAFKIDLDAWKADFDTFTFDFPFDLAFQSPTPFAVPNPPNPPQVYVDAKNAGSGEQLYDQARGYIDRDQYTRALDSLERLIRAGGTRTDAAMYWKAYSLSKMARAADALATLADMQKRFAGSRWIEAARSLEFEVKQASGQAVSAEGQANEEMKLLALQGMMRTEPETTLPIVEKMLAGNSSVRVKERALFVVSQSRTPRARSIIANVARANSNPDLQMAAIRHLGQLRDAESRQVLNEIYRTSSDPDVKRAILRSLMSANAVDELSAIARAEKDSELQASAIRYLGSSNRVEAADTLRTIYLSDIPRETRSAVIRALGTNRSGAKALVDLARAEKNVELKTEIVRVLSNMRDPVAREYMLELLK